MKTLRIAMRRLGIVGELFGFLVSSKRWWMLPMMAILLLFAIILILAQSSAVGPFIYSLF